MDTPTTGGAFEHGGNPQVARRAKKAKRRTPIDNGASRNKSQWLPMFRFLPQEAYLFTAANTAKRARGPDGAAAPSPAPEQPMPRTAVMAAVMAEEPNATTAPPKSKVPHKALMEHLPNLPEPWTKTTDRVGAVDHTPGPDGKQPMFPQRPLRNIVCAGPKEDIFSSITEDPAQKTVRYGSKYTPSQKMRSAEYSRAHGYDSEGKPDYLALVRDALNGRLLSRVAAYELALSYERIIADLKKAAPAPRSHVPAGAKRRHKRKVPTGDAEEAATQGGQPRKRAGRQAGAQQTEQQHRWTANQAAARLTAKAHRAMALCSATLGGAPPLTSFVVSMIRRVVKKTGVHKKHLFLKEDAVAELLEDRDVFKAIGKEIDKKRKPKLCQFVIAHLTGVTYSAMDKLRFATAWCPGHSTLSNEIRRLERCIEAMWCPSGPTPSHGTTRTAAQQAEAAAEAAQASASAGGEEENGPGAPGLGDQELATLDAEAQAAVGAARPQDAHDAAEIAAEDRQNQCLALLKRQFPEDAEDKLWDRWAGGMEDDTGVFVGANIIYVCAVRDSKVLGFAKALRTKFELFVDEVLVAEEERGPQGINTHLFNKLATTVAGRQRLQVKESNVKAIKSYRRMGYNTWTPSASGSFAEEQPENDCMFMQAGRATVLSKSEEFCNNTPLAEGIQLLVCAAMPIAGVTFDYVGKPVASAHGPDAQGAQPDGEGGAGRGDDEHQVEVDGVHHEGVTDPNYAPGGDDATHAAGDSGDGKVASSWGATSVTSAIATMLNALSEEEVPLEDSPQTKPCIKITCDAANLSNAPKGKRTATTVIMQLLSLGAVVRDGVPDFSNMVKYMVSLPQSCKRAFVLRSWFGKDDRPNCKENLVPHMVEAGKIEQGGMRADGGRNAPPWWSDAHVENLRPEVGGAAAGPTAPEGGAAAAAPDTAAGPAAGPTATAAAAKTTTRFTPLRRLPVEVAPGNNVNGGRRQTLRKVNVKGILLLPVFLYAFDGATTMYLAGCTHQSGQTDPFSKEMKADTKLFHRIAVIRRGQTLTDVAESISPGCSDKSSNMHWLLRYLALINNHSLNTELQAATREPELEDEENVFERLGKKAKRLFGRGVEDDGRSEVRPPYRDSDIEAIGYDHLGFVPSVDGNLADALTTKAQADGPIRVPVLVEHYTRELPQAAWTGQDMTGTINMRRFGLCIIHAGMRTLESCTTLMLEKGLERYLDGKGKSREYGDACNARVRRDLKMRKLFSVNKERKLNPISFNGEEVRILMEDLAGEDSKLIAAFKELYSNLNIAPENHKLDRWAMVMGHWARAFKAAYVLRATQGDRDIFRREVSFYVAKKAMLRAGACTWYDFQLYSIMTELFDKFQSLMLISQEGMEACQAAQNRYLRWSNHFTNAGRIPFKVLQAGFEAVRSYLAARLKQVKSPEWWLWSKNMNCFYATHHAAFEAAEECKKIGREWQWWSDYCPRWRSFMTVSRVRIAWGAALKRRKYGGSRGFIASSCGKPSSAAAYYRRIRTATKDMQTRGGFLGLKHPEHKKQIIFPKSATGLRVTNIHSKYGECLAKELAAYYELVPCEATMPEDIDDFTRRKLIQRERRKRWATRKQTRPPWWAPHPTGRPENTEW